MKNLWKWKNEQTTVKRSPMSAVDDVVTENFKRSHSWRREGIFDCCFGPNTTIILRCAPEYRILIDIFICCSNSPAELPKDNDSHRVSIILAHVLTVLSSTGPASYSTVRLNWKQDRSRRLMESNTSCERSLDKTSGLNWKMIVIAHYLFGDSWLPQVTTDTA